MNKERKRWKVKMLICRPINIYKFLFKMLL